MIKIEQLAQTVIIDYQYQDNQQDSYNGNTITDSRYLDPGLTQGALLPIIYHADLPQISRISWVKKEQIMRYEWLCYFSLVLLLWGLDRCYRALSATKKTLHALRHGQIISAQITEQTPLFSLGEKYRYGLRFVDAMGVTHQLQHDTNQSLGPQTDILFAASDTGATRLLTELAGFSRDSNSGQWGVKFNRTQLITHGLWWGLTVISLVGLIGHI